MMSDYLSIPVRLELGSEIQVEIFSENEDALFAIGLEEADEYGESRFQLKEGCFYEYRLPPSYQLESSEIVSKSKLNPSSGRISPNIYVGRLTIGILDMRGVRCSELDLEVTASKIGYREDYRNMLADITEQCTELLMHTNSPVSQTFTPDFYQDSKVLYQRFSFIKSIIAGDEFRESIHKIISSPVVAWASVVAEKDVRAITRLDRGISKQLGSYKDRIELPEHHPLKNRLRTIPRRLSVRSKRETVDNPENRFIKYALNTFLFFVQNFRIHAPRESKLEREANRLESELELYLSYSLFKEVSDAERLPLNSPVLQRKEGYREVLRVWLMFDLAAKLVWHGGDDVYSGGKKDIAVLYEYWVFFKLLDIVSEVFALEKVDINSLMQETSDGLGLQLRQGKYLPIKGVFESTSRKLNIEFSYNRTFSGNKEYPSGGSWTRRLRPDYTLSIWPFGVTQEQAEVEELIVHVHFDAKYKVDLVSDLFGGDEDIDEEKIEQKGGTYRRADLLKMHTYRDAIRRTSGAYIIYPGSERFTRRGFHEVFPGVGAFSLSPRANSGSAGLTNFFRDVVSHFLNRASQREATSYHIFNIHKNRPEKDSRFLAPEAFGENRSLIPDETFVLVAFYKRAEHYHWILKKGLYNARLGDGIGSLRLAPEVVGARYLLLHTSNETTTGKLFRILEFPRIFSREDLIKHGYPSEPSRQSYLVFKIGPAEEIEFRSCRWKIGTLDEFKSGRGSALPFSVTLGRLMKVLQT